MLHCNNILTSIVNIAHDCKPFRLTLPVLKYPLPPGSRIQAARMYRADGFEMTPSPVFPSVHWSTENLI